MAEVSQAFDLAAGPLLRSSLVKIDQNQHVLVLNLHHSICDGWSFGVLHRELAACYQDRSAPEQELAALPLNYAHTVACGPTWRSSRSTLESVVSGPHGISEYARPEP